MTAGGPVPEGYVPRREEDEIRRRAEEVHGAGTSRALLVYGRGGVGKTTLVQSLAASADTERDGIVWVPPIDVDDSEYWLLSNLETRVARTIDPEDRYFGPYHQHLDRLARSATEQVSYETVLNQLGRSADSFVECYRHFVRDTRRTVVITLDTVEAVRSVYLLLTLTQWMKELPSTLFVLSGRPQSGGDRPDPIREELRDPYRPMPFSQISLSGFEAGEAQMFLDRSPLAEALTPAERDQLVALTDGQPLWLALAVEYLQVEDMPPEMTSPLDEQTHPQEMFRRRLITLYRSTDFWPEAIKRLAVVRHSVDERVWRELMADRGLPPDADTWREAWLLLLARPWIRPRANRRYVTLHDALAEELAQRLVPLHDRDEAWRRDLWRRVRGIYEGITAGSDERVRTRLGELGGAAPSPAADERPPPVQRLVRVDAAKRELDQLLTARLHYEILDDFAAGTARFLALHRQAEQRRDPLFMELICHEMERFLPRGEAGEPLEDVLDARLRQFHAWLEGHRDRHVEIVVRIARHLILNARPEPALRLLDDVPDEPSLAPTFRYRLANERGNACMRIVGRVEEAEGHFRDALARTPDFAPEARVLVEAEAQKELGFYYRNLGRWDEADTAYRTARRVLAAVMGPGTSDRQRGEMASIQMNWAYLKALRGSYREARNLVDSAVAVRRRLGQRLGEGMALSVSGEVYRYESKYLRAWQAYGQAEEIFHELRNWPWLGQVHQEQAICLHQATAEGITVVDDQADLAVRLIRRSLDICRESAIRYYPSALNRAGRIFAATDVDLGLETMAEAVEEARRIGDGWFYSANLIEYVELNHRAWAETGDPRYRDAIRERERDVREAIETYRIGDTFGRWQLLQGHILVREFLNGQEADLDAAVDHFASGFRSLADQPIGSHGSGAIAQEFERFRAVFELLPPHVRSGWYDKLLDDWSSLGEAEQSTSLLARLEELY